MLNPPRITKAKRASQAGVGKTADDLLDTRTTLIEGLKSGKNESAWEEFFDIYWRLIHGFACKSGLDSSIAHDVVQEVMLSVLKQLAGFNRDQKGGSFRAWLLTITHRRTIDRLRREQHFVVLPETSENTAGGTDDDCPFDGLACSPFEALWDAEWEKSLMDAAVGTVKRHADPKKYQIFDFYVNKEWDPERVALAFGVSVGHVYVAKHRIVELIKGEINRLEFELRCPRILEKAKPADAEVRLMLAHHAARQPKYISGAPSNGTGN